MNKTFTKTDGERMRMTNDNPYESPGATTNDDANGRAPKWIGRFEIVAAIELVAVLLAAVGHRLQLSSPLAYKQSPLAMVVMLGILIAFVLGFVSFFRAIYFSIHQRWAQVVVNLWLSLLAFAAFYLAAKIDYALMYIT